jgi:hypothetical protein
MTTSCKKAAQLVSASMDRRLSTRERLSLGFHLLLCGMCRAYRRQLMLIRELLRDQMELGPSGDDVDAMRLSPQAKRRIGRALRNQP